MSKPFLTGAIIVYFWLSYQFTTMYLPDHKKTLLSFCFLLCIYTIYSQHEFGWTAGGGISKISTTWLAPGITKYPAAASANAGIYYNLKLGSYLLLGAELKLMQVEGRQKANHPDSYYFDSTGTRVNFSYAYFTKKHITYLGIPVYVVGRFKKLDVLSGTQFSYALRTAISVSSSFTSNGESITEYRSSLYKNDNNVYKYTIGLYEGVFYQATGKLKIGATYYIGIDAVPDPVNLLMGWWHPWKTQQLTISARYNLN